MNGAVLSNHSFGCNQNGNQEVGYIILLFKDGITCYARTEAESGLESESIFSGLSRSRNRLKIVEPADLVLIVMELMAPTELAQFS